MKKNIPADVQAAKLAKKHAKHKSRRNAKNGVVNYFKEQILQEIYDKKNDDSLRGEGFVTSDGRPYFQSAYVVETKYQLEDGTLVDKEPKSDEVNPVEFEVIETIVKKTVVRLD